MVRIVPRGGQRVLWFSDACPVAGDAPQRRRSTMVAVVGGTRAGGGQRPRPAAARPRGSGAVRRPGRAVPPRSGAPRSPGSPARGQHGRAAREARGAWLRRSRRRPSARALCARHRGDARCSAPAAETGSAPQPAGQRGAEALHRGGAEAVVTAAGGGAGSPGGGPRRRPWRGRRRPVGEGRAAGRGAGRAAPRAAETAPPCATHVDAAEAVLAEGDRASPPVGPTARSSRAVGAPGRGCAPSRRSSRRRRSGRPATAGEGRGRRSRP